MGRVKRELRCLGVGEKRTGLRTGRGITWKTLTARNVGQKNGSKS